MNPQEFMQTVTGGYAAAGWAGLGAAVLFGLVKLYRWAPIQDALPSKAKWDNWPAWGRWTAVVGTSMAGCSLQAVGGQIGWPQVPICGVTIAMGAMGLRSTTKALHKAKSGGAGSIRLGPPLPAHLRHKPPAE